jgi:RNA polymerase sigma-70 factor, ECF subfamily
VIAATPPSLRWAAPLWAAFSARRLTRPLLATAPRPPARVELTPFPAEPGGSTSSHAPREGAAHRADAERAADRMIVCDLLVRRAGAVTAAWRHFVPFVTRVLVRLGGGRLDLDDLSQEVFVRFFRKVDGLRDPDAVRAFLYGIALRVVKKEQRYRWLRRQIARPARDDFFDVTAPSDGDAHEASRRLAEHLATLKPEQRSLIVARYVEGLELKDVALAHSLSFNTMRRRLEAAWQRLERLIAEDDLLVAYLGTGTRGPR